MGRTICPLNLPSTGPHWDNLASKPITNVHGVTRDSLQIELAQVCSCFTYGMVFAKTLLRDDNLSILIADPIIKLSVSDYELILYTSIANQLLVQHLLPCTKTVSTYQIGILIKEG